MFAVRCVLLFVGLLFVACLLHMRRCLLIGVCCLLLGVCCSLFVGGCLLFDCWLVGCSLLSIVRCSLLVV